MPAGACTTPLRPWYPADGGTCGGVRDDRLVRGLRPRRSCSPRGSGRHCYWKWKWKLLVSESTVGIAFHRRLFSIRHAGEPPMDDAVRTPGLKSSRVLGALS